MMLSDTPRVLPNPRTTSGLSSRLRSVARTVVPTGTRMSGPGVESGLPSSPNAAIDSVRLLSPSGCHTPSRASSAMVSTPFDSVPAVRRLSLGATRSGANVLTGWASRTNAVYAIHLDIGASHTGQDHYQRGVGALVQTGDNVSA